MTCQERKDLIVEYAIGSLEGQEREELRAHLAGGCPQCAGALAEAEAILAQLPLSLDRQQPSPGVRQRLMKKIAARGSAKLIPMPARRDWERLVIPAALAAMLAVAVTVAAIYRFRPAPAPIGKTDPQKDMYIAGLELMVKQTTGDLIATKDKLAALQAELTATTRQSQALDSMKFVEMIGQDQPKAMGRVFIDTEKKQWYFFTSGMKPAAQGKTYELWLIADKKPIRAGTFEVGEHGTAALLGNVPAMPAGASVQLAVTDEPMPGRDSPSGTLQIHGLLQ
jgi:anti-sigma-K factor RskA